jgi:tRNA-dihydrouridine synthase A
MLPYIAEELQQGTALNHITRHLLGLFQGVPGARQFRRHLSEHAHRKGAGIAVLEDALQKVAVDDNGGAQGRERACG